MNKHNPEIHAIRVFISSTFSDMRLDREYLNKYIFPSLRKLCQQRGVIFTEVDLQWGITEEQAKNGGAIEVCLNEINHCHPYFIGLLGERYGWSPKDSHLNSIPVKSEDLKKQVGIWVNSGESVTAMEIKHGVLDNPQEAPYAYFYLRNPDFTSELFNKSPRENEYSYFETEPAKQNKLRALKERVIGGQGTWQVRNANSGYCSFESLGEMVKADIEAAINQLFPEGYEPTPLQRERSMHTAFARSRLSINEPDEPSSYIADENFLEGILDYSDSHDRPLAITGEMGSGKSALLANFAFRWKRMHQNAFVIEHYAGSGGDSDVAGVLRRIMAEIKDEFQLEDELPSNDESAFQDFESWISKVPDNARFLLVLDGVNQFKANEGELRRFIFSIPESVGSHFRVILSALNGESLEAIAERGWAIQKVPPLSLEQRRELVAAYLKHFRKTLPENLLARLVESNSSENPLYLRIILDELRVDVSHDQLASRLISYLELKDTPQLFMEVLSRWERDYSESNVPEVMSLIWASRYGLSDNELREISKIKPMMLSSLLYGMGEYLANREGLYGFMHDSLRQAVEHRYINRKIFLESTLHEKIASYFIGEDLSQRQIDELPWHWVNVEDKLNLQNYLKPLSTMRAFAKRFQWQIELLSYWNFANCNPEKMLNEHYKQLNEIPSSEQQEIVNLLGDFYFFAGYFKEAEILYRHLISLHRDLLAESTPEFPHALNKLGLVLDYLCKYAESEKIHREALAIWIDTLGENSREAAMCYRLLALVLSHQGKYEASEELHRKALRIRQDILGLDHQDTAQSINNLALILDNLGKYEESESLHRQSLKIFETVYGKLHPEVARCLNNLASVLNKEGKFVESEGLQRRSLSIRLQTIGEKHPDYARGLNGLALVLMNQGEYIEAEGIFRKAFDIYLTAHGMEHPDTAYSLDGLALAQYHQGRLDEAEVAFRQALDVRQSALGDKHPDTAHSMSNLATVLKDLGRPKEAEDAYLKALDIRMQTLGDQHPDTLQTIKDLSSL